MVVQQSTSTKWTVQALPLRWKLSETHAWQKFHERDASAPGSPEEDAAAEKIPEGIFSASP